MTAVTAIAEAVKLDEQERPENEAEQRIKEADGLEMARPRNRKIFQLQCRCKGTVNLE